MLFALRGLRAGPFDCAQGRLFGREVDTLRLKPQGVGFSLALVLWQNQARPGLKPGSHCDPDAALKGPLFHRFNAGLKPGFFVLRTRP